jgi:hypothetical protein
MPYTLFTAGQEALAADINGLYMAQTVARFPTAAARTAAIVAPVLNQVSILDNRPGFTQYWNGSVWVDAAPLVQGAIVSAAPVDGNSIVTVTFPIAYAAAPAVVASFAGSGAIPAWRVNIAGSFTNQFFARFYNEAGVAVAINTPVTFTWIATGVRV